MRTLKQVATNMADAFTRFGLWKGGGSGGSVGCSNMVDFDNVITTISAAKRIEYTAQENCYLYKRTVATGTHGNEKFSINGKYIGIIIYTTSGTVGAYALIPLKKDDTIVIENTSNETWAWQPITIYGVVKENYLHEYSTEEKVVGKWIDGRNVYESVINAENITLQPYAWTNIYMIENMEKIIDITCINGNVLNDGRLRWNCLNNFICGASEENNFYIANCTIIVQYIKTE